MNVGIQGELGSFHAEAAAQWFGERIHLVECASFTELFKLADEGNVDAIVTAVENTSFGSINEVYQLIDETGWPIIGEIKLPIAHQLIAQPGATLKDITKVYSHPVALAQCRHTITRLLPHAEMVEYSDTAAAVTFIKDEGDPQNAAIASKNAAKLHNLPILSPNVHDDSRNTTRFLVLCKAPEHAPERPNRASMVLITNHEPGALVSALSVFAASDVNLVKLQSQPIIGEPWHYKFFIVADCDEATFYEIQEEIEAANHSLKLLGLYQAA